MFFFGSSSQRLGLKSFSPSAALKCGCVGWGDSALVSYSGIDLGMSPMLSLAEASCFLLTGGKKDKFMRGLSLLWSVMGWRGSSL